MRASKDCGIVKDGRANGLESEAMYIPLQSIIHI